ncbi:MAG: adenylyltransferase/cytidyltransferase family protein [Pseudomonas sp.]|uniref:adenylyltransferase/cytidyltransferase family protein n=1 Tax=Pseudomonas sp. TaxID=306 RepID=UPI003BB6BC92
MARTVITYGTFDMFHVGHLRLLKRLRSLGDRLIVGVSTDRFNELKGKKTLIPFEQRAEIVEALDCVDMVIPEHSWEQKPEDIRHHHVDVFAIGDDWRGKFDYLASRCEVCYLERTEGISSSELKLALGRLLDGRGEQGPIDLEMLDGLRRSLP